MEPSLTLIHKICETLGITPNELLGFEDAPVAARAVAGFAEGSPEGRSGPRAEAHDALAWSLAEEIVKARREHEAGRKAVDPMLDMRETGALYRGLLAEPFETVARLAEEPAMMAVGSKQKAEIARPDEPFHQRLAGRQALAGHRRAGDRCDQKCGGHQGGDEREGHGLHGAISSCVRMDLAGLGAGRCFPRYRCLRRERGETRDARRSGASAPRPVPP